MVAHAVQIGLLLRYYCKIGVIRGYAFIEYDNPWSANEAVANMNLIKLGGQFLRVGKVPRYDVLFMN